MNNSNGAVYDAWIASASIPPDTVRLLLQQYGDAERCFNAVRSGEDEITGMLTPRFRMILEKNGREDNLKRLENLIQAHDIRVLRFDDPQYPVLLSEISQAPAILFYQGELNCLHRRLLAMVGSRAASYKGQKAARKLAADLSMKGISIVSGLACGIDAASHLGCLDGGSPTVAVTACGLDSVYPKENIRLHDEILLKQGLILSEYSPGEKPSGWHFPIRNRIIAGLSQALILIEAKIRSGSMTSVQHTLEQGKDVFVYPGDPESDYFEGNHQLLREGGIYFTSAEDILEDMHWLDNPSAVRQNIESCPEHTGLPPEQQAVILALKPGAIGFDQLLAGTHLDPPTLMSTLTIMQISGIIESLPGKKYQLKH